MTAIFIKVAQFLLSLSILIILHELGHFIPAKLFKTRVEKFYLFFDPWFSLFKRKIGETEYGVGWLPLGGYVKISGMIDESMDKEQMKSPPQPWEFRSKPTWQRLIIMLGGVTVNVILAFFIYSMMIFSYGKSYLPIENLTYGVYADSLLLEQGMHHGDQIIRVGDIKPRTLDEVNREILFGNARSLDVVRNGAELTISLPEEIDQEMLALGKQQLFSPRIPNLIDSIVPGSAADKAGIKKGDKVLQLNGSDVPYFQDFASAVRSNKGQEVNLLIQRGYEKLEVQAVVDSNGTLGFFNTSILDFLEVETERFGFFQSFPEGVKEGSNILVNYVRSLKLIFSKQGVQQVGGFITIGKLFGNEWNWERFWSMTALLSIILAVMNLLPIPALDGGHVVFLLYEMVTGRTPSQKFMEYAMLAGFALLLTLLIYANGMDIFRLFNN